MLEDAKKVEVSVDDEWEASYALSRENINKVHIYVELLQLCESNEIDLSDVDEAMNCAAVGAEIA